MGVQPGEKEVGSGQFTVSENRDDGGSAKVCARNVGTGRQGLKPLAGALLAVLKSRALPRKSKDWSGSEDPRTAGEIGDRRSAILRKADSSLRLPYFEQASCGRQARDDAVRRARWRGRRDYGCGASSARGDKRYEHQSGCGLVSDLLELGVALDEFLGAAAGEADADATVVVFAFDAHYGAYAVFRVADFPT
jgi:hypothetical protein